MDIEKLVKPHIRDIMVYEPGRDADDFIKLSSNENSLAPHREIVRAVTEGLETSNRYPPSGSPDMTDALAAHHGVDTTEIMVGNGSNEIIDLLIRAFVESHQNVVFPVPSFIVYGLIARICGCEGRGIDCREYRVDLNAMRAAVDENTRMVFICNPNNPTSTYVSQREVEKFLDGLPEEVLVVMDEAYIDYVGADDYPRSLDLRRERNTIIVLRTFSKFYSVAGIRIGYAIADPVVVRTLHQVRQPFNVNRLAQLAGMACLRCADDLKPRAAAIMAERDRVRDELIKLGISCPPSQTNFVLADLGDSALDLYQALYERGVIVRRLGQFGSTTNTYRITVGIREENDQLIAALQSVFSRESA